MFKLNRRTSMFFTFWILLFAILLCFQALTGKTYDNVSALLKGKVSKDTAVRKKAYADAGKLRKSDVPALLKELGNEDPAICDMAAGSLADLGAKKKLGNMENDVIAALRNLLKSEHSLVRQGAAIGLARMDRSLGKELVPGLIEAVRAETPEYKVTAVLTLGGMGKEAKDAVPAIIEAMKRQPKKFYIIYCGALERIGTPEAMEASKWYIRKREMLNLYHAPYVYFSDKPLLNFLITLGFVSLFWWSRLRRLAGKKVIYWPLLIPAIIWGGHTYCSMYGTLSPIALWWIANKATSIMLLATLVGLIPWLVSLLRSSGTRNVVD